MPYTFESSKMIIPEEYDKRVKLTAETRKEIYEIYHAGGYSSRQLARIYGVSKSRVLQIVNPELEKRVKERRKLNGDRYKESTSQRRETMRMYRMHKKNLYNKGVLLNGVDNLHQY